MTAAPPADVIIESLEPYPGELLAEAVAGYDAVIFFWNHETIEGKRPYKGAQWMGRRRTDPACPGLAGRSSSRARCNIGGAY